MKYLEVKNKNKNAGEFKKLCKIKRVFIMKSLSFTRSKKCDEGVFLSVCSCHVTYAFQSESSLWNTYVKLAKWLSVLLRTKWFWVRVQLQSLNLQSFPAFNLFSALFCFYTLWKYQKTCSFLMFSSVIDTEHWPEMG